MVLTNEEIDYEYADPEAKSLSQSLRAFGYDISTAIADLIDNSISAGSKNIYVQFEWDEKRSWVAVIDDGIGMTEGLIIINVAYQKGFLTQEGIRDLISEFSYEFE